MQRGLTKTRSKKKKNGSVSMMEQTEDAGTNMVSLINLSENNTHAQLLLNKPPIHKPEAGINPLVDAAAYVFLLLEEITRIRSHQELSSLQQTLMMEVKDFQQSIYLSKYAREVMTEYVPISSYILCNMVDDIIAGTSFGNEGKWDEYRLLHSHELEILPRESFLIILERFIQEPGTYIDIMEFTYICLSLGFKYSCHSSGFDAEQLQKILLSLYKHIRAFRGNVSRQLSPHSLKYLSPGLHKETFKSKLSGKISRIFKKSPRSSTYMTTCPNLMEHIIHLENRFQRATHFLNTRSVKIKGEKIRLNALPWQLFIGSAQSGKSTLIENSRIKFIASNRKDEAAEKVSLGPKNWHWWVSPESVMIDIGSDYLSLQNIDKEFINKPWEYFLDLIVNSRGNHGLKTVTIVISWQEIMDNLHQHQLIDDLSLRMQNLIERFGRDLSFNLVITKCDLIPGFKNFFADFTEEEIAQGWGARLPLPTADRPLADLIHSRFNSLIKRINNQMIYRFNQEKDYNFQSKISILGFPLQLEKLNEELGKIIRGFCKRDPAFSLKGFYLTSAIQDETTEEETNNLPQVIAGNKFLQSLKIMKQPMNSSQSYFVKQLLLFGLISDTNITTISLPPTTNPLLKMLKGK